MRLRQIALVAHDLAAAQADIAAVLGVDYAYDDPGVGKYGLRNAVFPVGDTFLEVVSPKQPGTTAGRLLQKRGGDGGYMVILQVNDLAQARARVRDASARIADFTDGDGFAFTHIHPKDVGGAILSLDHMKPKERWEWGGPGWQSHVRTDTSLAVAVTGAELQSEDPAQTGGTAGRRFLGGRLPPGTAIYGALAWMRARFDSSPRPMGGVRAWGASTSWCATSSKCRPAQQREACCKTERSCWQARAFD